MKIRLHNSFWSDLVAGVRVPRLKVINVTDKDGEAALATTHFFRVDDSLKADIDLVPAEVPAEVPNVPSVVAEEVKETPAVPKPAPKIAPKIKT